MQPCQLSATRAARLIKERQLSSEELVRSCLERIAKRDALVRAWLHTEPEQAIRDAREADKRPPTGALHGLPIGVKDVIDTADYPTTQNSPIYPGLRVGRDAACVALARGSGAVVLGKTDTVEFASSGRKALTRNPFNPAHTPGGTSSGSAAAVADFMAPIAFGTQTSGSLIRPAAFNGIYAMKPTWNRISREGVRMYSASLDTVGWYGRSVEDLTLVGEAFGMQPWATRVNLRGLRVGLCRSPSWPLIEPAGASALQRAGNRLAECGAVVEELLLEARFDGLRAAHAAISNREAGVAFLPEYVNAKALLAQGLKDKVENAGGISDRQLLESYALADSCRVAFDALFGKSLDVVLTPSAPGEAPEGLHTTGNAVFNQMWTLLHVPCVNIPAGRGVLGLPVGVQLVGPRLSDARLLAIAAAVAPAIDIEPDAPLRELW
ncbi:MAG: amidase [Betaproteobacteria bacterium]|nr:amidase [Betaproteobacteria bacterium]